MSLYMVDRNNSSEIGKGGRKNKQRGREREKKKILLPQKRNIVQSERERESHN